LNIGLRYEYLEPFYEKYNRLVSLDVSPDVKTAVQVFPDQTGPYAGYFPRSLVNSDKNNFGPRVGIAWKPRPRSSMVLRAGYAVFYNAGAYSAIVGQLVGQPPFAVGQNLLTSTSTPLTLQNGFPTDPVAIRNSYAIDPDYRIGYIQTWNLGVQTQLSKIYILEVAYNGTKGTRLDILRAPNRAPLGSSPDSTGGNLQISNAETFLYQSSGANSIMHSGMVRVSRRFSHGLQLSSSYTLAKSIDDASALGNLNNPVVVQNDRDIFAERSLSSLDRRHNFSNNFSIELPMGQNRRFFAGSGPVVQKMVAGWNLNGSYNIVSGGPLTARILGNVSNNSGTGSQNSERADVTGQAVAIPAADRTTSEFFNTLAFAIPQPGSFGNAGRNTIVGPGSQVVNLSLRKSFQIGDNSMRRLGFQWQVSNLLNHPNYGSIATTVNALNFGRVTGVAGMRRMTFNLSLNF
jgi:trimeric autotransporter adhesin